MSTSISQGVVTSTVPTTSESPGPLSPTTHGSEKPEGLYDRLDDGCIRLITLLPGNVDAPLCCSLRTVHLLDFEGNIPIAQSLDLPEYEAVSYTWGDGGKDSRVTCDSFPLHVTQSLSDVLRRFRYEEKNRVLWVDGICINQDDVEERGRQVKMMGLIYWRAQKVLIWLGPDDEEDSRWNVRNAVKLIHRLEQLYRNRSQSIQEIPSTNLYDIEKLNDRDDANEWEAFRRLLGRKWFTRVWVVQELGLAKEATFHCGSAEFSLDTLHDAYSFMITEAYMLVNHFEIDFQMLQMVLAYQDSTRNNIALDLGKDPFLAETFLDILELGKGLQSTDPKDKIYAFLGHPSAFKRHLLDVDPYSWYSRNYYYKDRSTIIQPDYEKDTSVFDVYFRLAHNAVQDLGLGTELLCYVAHDEETIEDGLPSWVPRWDSSEKSRLTFGPFNKPPACTTFPPMPFEIEFSEESIDLHIRALRLSKVQFSWQLPSEQYFSLNPSEAIQSSEDTTVSHSNLLEEYYNWLQEQRSSLPNPSFNDAISFACTFTAHLPKTDEEARQRLHDFEAYLRAKARSSRIEPSAEDISDTDTGNANFYCAKLQHTAPNRAFFVTSDGRLGLGPRIMRKGDELWLPIGSRLPFALRPTVEGRFKVLGQTYLYGVMQGEALAGLNESDFEDIILS